MYTYTCRYSTVRYTKDVHLSTYVHTYLEFIYDSLVGLPSNVNVIDGKGWESHNTQQSCIRILYMWKEYSEGLDGGTKDWMEELRTGWRNEGLDGGMEDWKEE